jgi:hypothetical protein
VPERRRNFGVFNHEHEWAGNRDDHMLKLLRKLAWLGLMGSVLASAYAAVPFYTAWTIREAIKANDSAYLQDKIEWTSVRSTLKESLGKFAFNASGEMTQAPEKPGLWQRIKAFVGRGAVDKFVDTTVTPTGMAGLFELRKAYKGAAAAVTGVDDGATKLPLWTRVSHFWKRVTRAEFIALDRFEMDVIDKDAPERSFAAVLELRGLGWKMTELRVKTTDPAKVAAHKLAAL